MSQPPWTSFLAERLAVAFVSGVAATLTLLIIFPLTVMFAGSGSSGNAGFDLVTDIYAFVFSRPGFLFICGTAITGFIMGPERMTNIFSFFWGTHPFWVRIDAKLWEKRNVLPDEEAPGWLVAGLLIALAVVTIVFIWD